MIFRVDKTKDYTVMSNYHLREKKMSLKAKGLLSWMLSNDDEWDYSIAGIVANCKENETSIKTTLKELQEFGYLEIIKKKPDKEISTIHYEYIVHEQPAYNQDIENQGVENLRVENQVQRNTNIINTNISNNKVLSKDNTTEFLGSAKKTEKKQKENLYTKCVNLINDFTDDEILKSYLIEFLKMLLENSRESGSPFYTNTFKGKLNKLKSLSEDNYEQRKIVLQTLDNGWNGFYPLKEDKKTKNVARDIEQLDGYVMKQGNKNKLRRAIENGTTEQF